MFSEYFALQSKLANLCSGGLEAARACGPTRGGGFAGSFGGAGGIAHHLLQHLEIIEIALAALRRDPADRLRPVAVVALLDCDQASLLEHLQVAGEIAVGEAAHLLERAEDQTFRMRRERGEH